MLRLSRLSKRINRIRKNISRRWMISMNLLMQTKAPIMDVLFLFSGGKDSAYVLYRLVNMGYKVLTFTFDNGFISEGAFTNIKNITKKLGVDHRVLTADQMKSVFVKSLKTYSNVCNGCWNAINGLGARLAEETGCKVVISGLSRGQIFDMRLWGLFQLGIFDVQEIEEKLLMFKGLAILMTISSPRRWMWICIVTL